MNQESLPPALHQRFQLLRRLGTGGMGVVYEAIDARRGLTVALKMLTDTRPESVAVLKREFRIAAELLHPNLLRLYDLVVDPNLCFFTMEVVIGQEANHYLQEDPEHQKLFAVLSQLCGALDVLHQTDVVHRDLKPSNILVTQQGQVKLLDFGIAQPPTLSEAEGENKIMGTPHYMSPEQVQGGRVTAASDLYSVGVILYFFLTGQTPFQHQNMRQLLMAHLREAPLPPREIKKEIPPRVEELCLALLSKEPEGRPTLSELATFLESCGAPPAPFGRRRARRFVGRTHESALLLSRAEEAEMGKKSAVLIGGESGTGKSSLCIELCRSLPKGAWRLISGRCYDREEIPFNALDPLVDGLAGLLAGRPPNTLPNELGVLCSIFPALAPFQTMNLTIAEQSASQDRQKAKTAFKRLLPFLAQERPILYWIDDLQWADQDSLEFLASLLSGAPPFAFFLLGTFRGGEQTNSRLAPLMQLGNVEALWLSPLGVKDLQELLGEDATPALTKRLLEETGGNAFLAAEIAQALFTQETGNIQEVLSTRLASLPPEQRRILESLAVAGGATSFDLLQTMTSFSPAVLSSSLDELRVERWLSVAEAGREDCYDLYHDRLREVVFATLPERAALHERYAQLLATRGEAEGAAGHYIKAKQPLRAAPWLLEAARRAAVQLATQRAVSLYQEALAAGGPHWEMAPLARFERAELLESAGGRYAEAARAFQEAAAYTSSEETTRLLLRAAEADLKNGQIEQALEAAKQAIAPYHSLSFPKTLLGAFPETIWRRMFVSALLRSPKLYGRTPSIATSLVCQLYYRLGNSLFLLDLTSGLIFSSRALTLALSHGSDEDILGAVCVFATGSAFQRGRKNIEQANRLFRWVEERRSLLVDPYQKNWFEACRGMITSFSGCFEETRQHLTPLLPSISSRTGFDVSLIRIYLAISETSTGYPRRGASLIKPWMERARNDQDIITIWSLTPTLVYCLLLAGEYEEAEEVSSSMPPGAERAPLSGALRVHRASLLLARRRPKEAEALLEDLLSAPFAGRLSFFPEYLLRAKLQLAIAKLSLAKGAPFISRRLLLRQAWSALQPVLSCDDPILEGSGFRVAGLVCQARGETSEATLWLDRAVASLADRGEAIELAAALLARGALTKIQDDTLRAQKILSLEGAADPASREGGAWHWR